MNTHPNRAFNYTFGDLLKQVFPVVVRMIFMHFINASDPKN